MSRTAPTRSVLALSAVAAAALLSLSACGSGGSQTAVGSTSQQGAGVPGSRPSGFGGDSAGFPGASGKIAAISGKTLQVQGSSSQVAVTYTAKTTFTDEVSVAKSDVKVGSCVMVTPDRSSTSSTSSSSSGSGSVTAGSVRVSTATNGSCTQGFGGFRGGERPSGAPSGGAGFVRPSGAPTDLPSGMPSGGPGGGRGGFGFGAFGKVTAVSATGFTVASSFPAAGGSSTSTTDVAVTVSGDTTYTTTKSATASALKVGLCASASGSTDDTGAITADRISISQPVDGECGGGFGGGRGGFGGAR